MPSVADMSGIWGADTLGQRQEDGRPTGGAGTIDTWPRRLHPRQALDRGDPRVTQPLFTLRESAAYLDIPVSTLHAWARPKDAAPLVTAFPRAGRSATVPFVGFAESYVLSALRRAGVPMQRIRRAVAKLDEEIGLEHALASERVYTDGAEVIFDYAERSEDDAMLAVVRTGQRQLEQIIRGYLNQITYGGDGWAARLRLPAYAAAQVVVDPRQAFGQPLVVHGGARVEDLVDRFQAGDGLSEIADEFAEAGRRGRIVPMKIR